MHAVEFHHVSKAFGGKPALDAVSLTVEPGRFTVVCGPPKAGKSVLFRLLVGLDVPDSGTILLDGRDITQAPPSQRPTVFENIAYPLRLARAARDDANRKVDAIAAMLSIGHLLKKTPDQLSGGEKQRVAVARGLVREAKVFVLDDPLVGLDYKLRERLMDELKQLCDELKTTFLYTTSDSLEALNLAQSIVVLDEGHLVEQADAIDLYLHPQQLRSLEVVGFPRANIIASDIQGQDVGFAGFRFQLPAGMPATGVTLGIRPEDVVLDPEGGRQGRVAIVEHLGSEIVLYSDVDGVSLTSAYPADNVAAPLIDSTVAVSIAPDKVMVFDRLTGRFIGRCSRSQEGA